MLTGKEVLTELLPPVNEAAHLLFTLHFQNKFRKHRK